MLKKLAGILVKERLNNRVDKLGRESQESRKSNVSFSWVLLSELSSEGAVDPRDGSAPSDLSFTLSHMQSS